jgi:hypothetical protein
MRNNDAIGLLVSTYEDWGHVLANPRFFRKGNIISWKDNSHPMLADPVMPADINQLAEDRQYTFQIADDGAIIQIYYEFENDGITMKSAMLAYYSTAISIYMPSIPPFVRWLRFDYAPKHARGVLHHDCHLHLSYFPDSRIAVKGLPNPKQFVELILALCYPDIYKAHRLNSSGEYHNEAKQIEINRSAINLTDSEIFKQMTYLCIPSAI